MITAAETRVLHLIATHGKAVRVDPKGPAYSWTWRIAGEPKSGPVDSLIRKGVLTVTKDKSSAILSQKGKEIMREAA